MNKETKKAVNAIKYHTMLMNKAKTVDKQLAHLKLSTKLLVALANQVKT